MNGSAGELGDEDVVRLFVENRGLAIARVPDRENRSGQDIDAVAGDLAIEHTSVDAYEGQRREGSRFADVLGTLEPELGTRLTYRLRILVPHDAVVPGSDWDDLKTSMRRWILEESPKLPAGTSRISDAAGLEFGFAVERRDTGSKPGLFFIRPHPDDRPQLADLILGQITRKTKKLAPYRAEGFRAVLLIESNDISLMSCTILVEAILKAFGGVPPGADEVWFADTSGMRRGRDVEFFDLTPDLRGSP